MLSVKNLDFSYGKNKILEDVNFDLEYRNLVCLLGANGAGKSTLLKSILQLLENYKGKIAIDGKDLKNLNQRKRSALLAYIPQEYKSAFNFSVEEVVLMSTTTESLFKIPREKELQKMEKSLKKIKIEHLRHRKFHELSGGERQLVLIARALAQGTKILIMDEPTSNLDFGNQIYLMQLVKKLANDGYLVFLSTHNPDFALRYADRVLILHDKKIIADGIPEEAMTSENLSKIYKNDIVIADIENSYKKTCITKEDIL